jgi:hypothetical protein
MLYKEFAEKLEAVKAAFAKEEGRDPVTMSELEAFVQKKVPKTKSRGLRSLKGLSF